MILRLKSDIAKHFEHQWRTDRETIILITKTKKQNFLENFLHLPLSKIFIIILELSFDSPLYRLIVKENQPIGTIINGARLTVKNSEKFDYLKYHFDGNDPINDFFKISNNGLISINKNLDLETMPVDEKGIANLNVVNFIT